MLIDETSVEKISILSSNVGVTYSGMGPDFRVLTRRGRKAAQQYYLQYVDAVPMTQLVREVGSVMQEFTQQGCVALFFFILTSAIGKFCGQVLL